VVALEGELGSGKTVLVQGIAEGLGVTGQVHSPTFVLHHRYSGQLVLDHFDLYRLDSLSWVDAGLDEPAPTAVTVVEWSERAAPLQEWATVRISLEPDGEAGRVLTCLKGSAAVVDCFQGFARR
jgi:tRNA threonylcarbamoyladenosine biosynthesis protein TsaE